MNEFILLPAGRAVPPVKFWWIIWAANLSGLVMLYAVVGHGPVKLVTVNDLPLNLAGLVPLFVSIVIRWLVLPRSVDIKWAFYLFLVGVVLAETCGILGVFLGGPYRDSLFVLGALGIAQYVPFYAKKLFDPKGAGFIPNN